MNGKYIFSRKKRIKKIGGEKEKMKNGKSIVAIAIAAIMMVSVMTVIIPATVAQHEEGAVNTLRVYGEDAIDATFPYTDPEGPFDPTNAEAPPKDFVTFNPAFMYHFKNDFFRHAIVVSGSDASEKVFLRQWYVPEYPEPRGDVWTFQEPVISPDIVNEYTYMLVSAAGEEPVGAGVGSSFVFPIADNDDTQIGLDSYDVNGDTENDRVVLKNIADFDGNDGIIDAIDISTDTMKLHEGAEIQFLDYIANIKTVTTTTVVIEVYYQGNENPERIKEVTVPTIDLPQTIFAGRHSADVGVPTLLDEPGYFELTSVDDAQKDVHIAAGRLLQHGETFFVDCAEYDVAMIHGYDSAFKYITIRNPLPKEPVTLQTLTIEKCPVAIDEKLPMLPPFNEVHDIIDDIDVAHDDDCLEGVGYSIVGDELIPDDDCISDTYDTVMERRVEDQPELVIKYTAETTEPRFHTNLLEIYDDESDDALTPGVEDWKWLHTWTKPDAYTEFDYPVEVLMTSSFTAPNSGGNRIKFVYDAAINSNGIYVNAEGPCRYDINGDGEISRDEVINAIQDYYDDVITRDLVIDVIQLYYGGPGVC